MTTTKYGGYTAAELRALTEQPHFNVKSASIIRDLLDALSARAEATQAGAVPGWRLVPIEPDLKMVIAGENYIGRHAWAKMLAAAPQPPVAEATQKCDGSGAIPVSVDDWTECPSCNGAGCRPVPHKWNDEGEQCTKCGDKDWMADASCSERLVKSPGMTSEEILLIASRTLDADTAPPASEVVKLARALFAAAPQPARASEARFIAEHGHRLAQLLCIDAFDIADRDAQIMAALKNERAPAQPPARASEAGAVTYELKRIGYATFHREMAISVRLDDPTPVDFIDGYSGKDVFVLAAPAPQPARASEADRATALLCRDLTDDDMDKLITWLGEHERNEIGHQGLCDRIISAFARTPAQQAAPLTDDARDAARYRWLSRQAVATRSYEDHTNRWEVDYVLRGMSFGAAIDAARAALQSHSEREA